MAFTGDPVVATAVQIDAQSTAGTTTSATYTATLSGGTACGIAFVAPPSGIVLVHNSCQVQATAGFSFASIQVRTGGTVGSGTIHTTAIDDNAVICPAAGTIRAGVTVPIVGLTPGNIYNAQQMYVGGGTGTFSRKNIAVVPQP